MAERLTLSYYPWIKQGINPDELKAAVSKFSQLLQTQLRTERKSKDLEIQLLPQLPVPDQLKELEEPLSAGLIGKIGLLNPIGYALVHSRAPQVKAIAVIRRTVKPNPAGPTYRAQLYVHKRTPIETLEGARGKTHNLRMAFGSPHSTSNFLVPALMLWYSGIHPLNGFKSVHFAGGHDTAALAVYSGDLEVGAGHDGAIALLKDKFGKTDAEDVMVRLAWSEPITSDPVAIHTSDPDLGRQLADALIALAAPNRPDSEGNQAVKAFWDTPDGFQTVDPEAYAALLEQMQPLGLRPDDLMRKA